MQFKITSLALLVLSLLPSTQALSCYSGSINTGVSTAVNTTLGITSVSCVTITYPCSTYSELSIEASGTITAASGVGCNAVQIKNAVSLTIYVGIIFACADYAAALSALPGSSSVQLSCCNTTNCNAPSTVGKLNGVKGSCFGWGAIAIATGLALFL